MRWGRSTAGLSPRIDFAPRRRENSGQYIKATLHPGVADPADASHFTIPYDAEGRRHTLHGYLRDDGVVRFHRE